MANADTPFGLIPRAHKNGAPYNGAYMEYYVPGDYSTALYVGDPVTKTGTANTSEYKGNSPGTLPEVNKTGDGTDYTTGVIVGFEPDPDNLSYTYNPADNERIVYVADDPELVFEIQEDGGGTVLDETDVGYNADYITTHSGSTITGKSGVELDRSSIANTNTLQLRVLRLVNRVDNVLGDNAKWEVAINLHTERYLTGL